MTKLLLVCGILASLVYVGVNVFLPFYYPGYNVSSQTVSELSAIDAPTRKWWLVSVLVYSLLMFAFGFGLLKTANRNHHLRTAGIVIVVYVVIGLFWPPMHQRAVLAAGGKSLTDTLHIIFTIVTVPLMLAVIVFGASAFGRDFRMYSIITGLIMVFFGGLTSINSSKLEANLPTAWMGVWERISITAYMIWIIIFSAMQIVFVSKNRS